MKIQRLRPRRIASSLRQKQASRCTLLGANHAATETEERDRFSCPSMTNIGAEPGRNSGTL